MRAKSGCISLGLDDVALSVVGEAESLHQNQLPVGDQVIANISVIGRVYQQQWRGVGRHFVNLYKVLIMIMIMIMIIMMMMIIMMLMMMMMMMMMMRMMTMIMMMMIPTSVITSIMSDIVLMMLCWMSWIHRSQTSRSECSLLEAAGRLQV